MAQRPRTALQRLEKSVGQIASAATAQMERDLPWFRQLSAEDRSWIGLIVQAGIRSFVSWAGDPKRGSITADIFGTAPQKLTRVITLQQTVEMVRMSIDVIEGMIDDLVGPDDAPVVHEAVLLFGREVAFGTAEVYARAAEMRGAWDARLEALVVDSVLRGEADDAVRSRAAALGWESESRVVVVLGRAPSRTAGNAGGGELAVDEVRRSARSQGLDALCAVQGDRLVVVLGGVDDPDKAAGSIAGHFGDGAVVVGPLVADLLSANVSARAAVAGLRAANGWPAAPRPVSSDDLFPERALAGDGHARRQLVQDVYAPLVTAGPTILDTTAAFLESGGSIEATARALFVHPNTVRYRLRRVAELTGLSPNDQRHAYTLRIALTLGRLMSADTSR